MSPDKSEPRVYTVGEFDYEGFHFRDEEDKYTDDVPVGEKVVLKSSYDQAIQLKDDKIKEQDELIAALLSQATARGLKTHELQERLTEAERKLEKVNAWLDDFANEKYYSDAQEFKSELNKETAQQAARRHQELSKALDGSDYFSVESLTNLKVTEG